MHALMKALLRAAALAVVMSGAAASLAAEAPGEQRARTVDGDRLLLAQADCTSLNEAVERVRRQYNGRIVSAETRIRGRREVHHIKVLTEAGKVKTVTVPGCTRGT